MDKYLEILHNIHNKMVNFIGGSMQEEFIEQVMSCKAITEYYK